jgi:dTDP-4-amino-4,6-dideoxygalactose transaminase
MSIPVFRSYIKRKDMDTVLSCLVTDSIGPGEYLDRFQKGAREAFGYDFGFAVRSPYHALALALDVFGLAAGDTIALSALAPSWYVAVLKERQLLPLFVDPALENANPSAEGIAKAVEAVAQKPKALIWSGDAGILPEPELFAEAGIPVIEDFTKALGSTRQGSPAKSIGQLTIVGLEHGSVITAGGGALLYAQGKREASVLKNLHESLPSVLRMPDYNAALGFAQLRELERGVEKRREIRQLYSQALAGNRHKGFQQSGEAEGGCWSFPVVIESSSKDAIAYAKKKDVETEFAFAESCSATGLVPEGSCPNARSLVMRTLLFPLHQRIGGTGAQKIARVLATLP